MDLLQGSETTAPGLRLKPALVTGIFGTRVAQPCRKDTLQPIGMFPKMVVPAECPSSLSVLYR
jgi:hypothetical protein